MIKVFQSVSWNDTDCIVPEDDEGHQTLRFDGSSRAQGWEPVRVRTVTVDERGRPRAHTDMPAGPGDLLLRPRALKQLGRVVQDYGEILPLQSDSDSVWVFNVTRLVDALDEERSDLLRSVEPGNRILRVRKPVFRADCLKGLHLFKVRSHPMGITYFTDMFVDLVREHDLTGLDFKLVWAQD